MKTRIEPTIASRLWQASRTALQPLALTLALLAGLAAPAVRAVESPSLLVTTLADTTNPADGMISLREAIAYSTADSSLGGRITFTPSLAGGTIILTQGHLELSDDIQIDGLGADLLSINANRGSRIFHIPGSRKEVAISNLTITNGWLKGGWGGAIFNEASVLTLTGLIITGNSIEHNWGAVYGGGIYNDRGSMILTNVTINGNSVSGDGYHIAAGGGIYNNSGNLTLTDVVLSGNSSGYGGGLFNQSGSVVMRGADVIGNSGGYGGGIYNGSGMLDAEDGEIANNNALYGGGLMNSSGTVALKSGSVHGNSVLAGGTQVHSYGGGIFNGGILSLTHVEVTANNAKSTGGSANAYGGGIYHQIGVLDLAYVKIRGNSVSTHAYYSSSHGGAIHIDSGTATVSNSEISLNTAGIFERYGNSFCGGIYQKSGTLEVRNSTIVHNQATTSTTRYSPAHAGGVYVVSGANALVCNSIVALNDLDDSRQIEGVVEGSCNLVGVDPFFVDAENGDYRLTGNSLAINLGDNAEAVDPHGDPLETDLAQQARIVGERVDIGAYEFPDATPAHETPSGLVNTLEDVVDRTDGKISLREAVVYATVGDRSGVVRFESQLDGGVITLGGKEIRVFGSCVIDAMQLSSLSVSGNQQSRVLYVGGGASVQISGLTISGGLVTASGYGSSARGGGIYNNHSQLTLSHVNVISNSVSATADCRECSGGGIFNRYGHLVLQHVGIVGNLANDGSSYGYSSAVGGGIHNDTGTVESRDVSFAGNIARSTAWSSTVQGGALYSSGNLTLSQTSICGNSVSISKVYNSSAYGGGIFNAGGVMHAENIVVCRNTGHGIYSGSETVLVQATISRNSSTGVVVPPNISATLVNSIVALNGGEDVSGSFVGRKNLVGVDPLFVDSGNDNFRLGIGSLAINRGSNESAVDAQGAPLAFDFAGESRIVGEQIDIGAYEFQGDTSGYELSSGLVTTLRDVADPSDGIISLREAVFYESLDSSIGYVNFHPMLSGGVIRLTGHQIQIVDSCAIDAGALGLLTIDACGQSRIFHISKRASVTLTGLTLTGGFADKGGGIFNDDGELDLVGMNVTDNTVSMYGGGVYNSSGSITWTGGQLRGNTATNNAVNDGKGFGGGLYNDTGSVHMDDVNITFNSAACFGDVRPAGRGGGIYNKSGTMNVERVTIANNYTQIADGSNGGGSHGGGIFNENGVLALVNALVVENIARPESGSMQHGGGVFSASGSLTVRNATIARNSNEGVYLDAVSTTLIANSIITLNGGTGVVGLFDGSNNFIDMDPLFVDIANGDYRPVANSPVIDAGDDDSAVNWTGHPLDTDMAGNPRIIGDKVDIGAFEADIFQWTIISEYGDPIPAVGTYHGYHGTVLTNSVTARVSLGTTQHVCTGWTGTGSVPASGGGTNVSFTITADSSIVWHWATNYWLETTAAAGAGQVTGGDVWVAAGTEATLTASASEGFRFDHWLLDGQPAGGTINLLQVPMDVAHTVAAYFVVLDLAEAVDNHDLAWTSGGNANWLAQTAMNHDGIDAARSGVITHKQTTWLETTVTNSGTLSFWWKVSSEKVFDVYGFLIDGVQQQSISGEKDWALVSLRVEGAGPHVLKWQYAKDKSFSAGEDCGWLDQVVWLADVWLDTEVEGNGSVDTADGWHYHGTNVVITATPAAHNHFAGWSGDTSGCSTNGLEITASMTQARKITASFAVDTYMVTFDAGGGSVSPATRTVAFNAAYGTLPTPTRTGYTCAGWWTESGGAGSEITAATLLTNPSNHTLYAKWLPNSYTVTFDANGGSVSPGSNTVAFDAAYGVLPTPTRMGYTCGGWWTEAGAAGAEVTAATVLTAPSNHTLYAKWIPNTYTLTYDAEGGIVTPKSKAVVFDAAYGLLGVPSRAGYAFGGWWTGDDGTGSEITATTLVMTAGTHTLYAKWTPNSYTVTYNAEDGLVTPTSKSVAFGAAYGLLATPTRTGYTFGGWWSDPPGVGAEITAATVVKTAQDHSLYAKWTINVHNLIVASAHGTLTPTVGTHSYDWGTEITCSATSPDTQGTTRYTCSGWTGTGMVSSSGIGATTTISLTEDSSITWNWNTEYFLGVNRLGGNGTTTVTGAWHAPGSAATVEASANSGFRFDHWILDGAVPTDGGTASRIVVPMDAPHGLTAVFVVLDLPEALDNPDLAWTSGGDVNWFPQTAASHDGIDAAQSGAIVDYQTTWVETTVSGSGTLSFWWKVSSEQDFDRLGLRVDNTERTAISGETQWEYITLHIEGTGNHSLRWQYAKDKSDLAGADCGWLDQVVWTPDTPPLHGFALWANQHGLNGDSATHFYQDHNSNGVPNGLEYAYGANLPPDGQLLKIRNVNGRRLIETPVQDAATLPYLYLQVLGSTDLIHWSLMVIPATDTTGMPANRLWYETAGPPLQQAFFKLEAKLRNAGDGSFDQWLSAHGLSGTAVALFQQDRNGDHVPNGLEYVFGANLPTDGPLLKIRSVNGRTVLEAPEQDAATLPYVNLRVLGSTDLVHWSLGVIPAADTTGMPANRIWYQPVGPPLQRAFFKLEADLK
jgi:uncharacterized repeat protein (TIGR02543 family)